MKHILAADIGGTNSRFAFFTYDGVKLEQKESVWLSTKEATSFQNLLDTLQEQSFSLSLKDADAIVFGIAGPVENGRSCIPPNITWHINLDALPDKYNCSKAVLVNDFVAQAYACKSDAVANARVVNAGSPVEGAPIGVLGAGTGFGKCLLIQFPDGTVHPVPSEGGHALFPFLTSDELAFADFLKQETGRDQVVGDMVLSGTGLRTLHTFMTGEQKSSREVAKSLSYDNPVLQQFAALYGRACHNFALETLCLGGLYIAGGLAGGNPILVENQWFLDAFMESDTHEYLLRNIPVMLNINEESGLWGAAKCGAQMI